MSLSCERVVLPDVQAIMVVSRSSPRELLSSHHLRREVAWGVMVACLLTGCQSLNTSLLGSAEKPHEFAVDLSVDNEETPDEGSWGASTDVATAHANYDAVTSRSVSQQEAPSRPANNVTTGHSFATRRLTLRRPVPVETDTVDKTTTRAPGEVPQENRNHDEASLDEPVSAPGPGLPRARADRGRLWSEDSGVSAWRPNASKSSETAGMPAVVKGSAPDRSRRPTATADIMNDSPSVKMTSTPSSAGVETADLTTTADVKSSPAPGSVTPGRKLMDDSVSVDETGTQQAEAAAPKEGETNQDNSVADGTIPEAIPAEEPGVLERLRGFYAPRPSDTEKLRRQMRKLSDPFGLLKERDEDAGPTSSIVEQSPEPAADAAETALSRASESVGESRQT
ncbi:MAG: hypothetical protein ACK58L_15760, partial [Planctomycetota bacterium]